MSYTLDPSAAAVDLDVMTLTHFRVMDPEPNTTGPLLSLSLSGGLGRITVDGERLVTDQVDKMTVTGQFVSLDDDQRAKLGNLLARWRDWNTPLRFLDFGDRAYVLEDGDHFIVVPGGERHLRLMDSRTLDD